MSADEPTLAARREQLLRRSSDLRTRIAADAVAISGQLRIVDKATVFLRSGGGRALLWGGMALIMFSGPRRALRLAGRSTLLWSIVRRWLPRVLALKRGPPRA
jgi:hypothetical protein